MSHSTSAIHGGSDIVSDLLSDTVTIEAAMTQRRLAAQAIERMRKDEANAVEYRRVLADEIDRLSAENATLKAERDSFCMDYRMRCDVETKTLHAEIERLQARVAELETALLHESTVKGRVRELLDALKRHGGHDDDCAGTAGVLDDRCTCGLAAAVRGDAAMEAKP